MSMKLIIVLLVVLAIFVGSLEQVRIALRWKPKNTGGSLEARRNTMRGELAALALGITQVQGYIDNLKKDQSEEAIKVAAEAQTGLDQAKAIKAEVEISLDKADSETSMQICTMRLENARFYVHQARVQIENHTGQDEDDNDK